jgi:iron complex transport system substrate-binding protein
MRKRLLTTALLLALFWAGPAQALELTDDSGRTIRFDKPFSRVVSLYGAHAENLAAMGAGAVLAGVSEPEAEAPGAALVSARDGAERIAALGPDLVLMRPMHLAAHPGLAAQLERLGVAVVSLQPGRVADLPGYWLALGRLVGREAKARAMAEAFAADVAALSGLTADIAPRDRQGVFFEAIHRQMKTVSPDSMAAFVLETAGGINLARDAQSVSGSNIAHFGLERLVAMGGSVDVYLAQKGPMNPVSLEEILATPGLAGLKAVRDGRVFLVDEALVSRPTPRLIQGIRAVGALLYPGLFPTAGVAP